MNENPWQTLATRARALAELADRYADTAPAALAPADAGDPLAELDAAALALVGAAAGCRRATYRALQDAGMTKAEIGRRWGISGAAVGKALSRDQGDTRTR